MSRRKQAKPQHINSEEQPPDAASGKGGPRCFAARLMRGGGSGAISGGGAFLHPRASPSAPSPVGLRPLFPAGFLGALRSPSGAHRGVAPRGCPHGGVAGWCCPQHGPRGPRRGGLRCPASPPRPAEQRRIPPGGRGVRRPRALRVRPRGRGPPNLPWGGKDFGWGGAGGRGDGRNCEPSSRG